MVSDFEIITGKYNQADKDLEQSIDMYSRYNPKAIDDMALQGMSRRQSMLSGISDTITRGRNTPLDLVSWVDTMRPSPVEGDNSGGMLQEISGALSDPKTYRNILIQLGATLGGGLVAGVPGLAGGSYVGSELVDAAVKTDETDVERKAKYGDSGWGLGKDDLAWFRDFLVNTDDEFKVFDTSSAVGAGIDAVSFGVGSGVLAKGASPMIKTLLGGGSGLAANTIGQLPINTLQNIAESKLNNQDVTGAGLATTNILGMVLGGAANMKGIKTSAQPNVAKSNIPALETPINPGANRATNPTLPGIKTPDVQTPAPQIQQPISAPKKQIIPPAAILDDTSLAQAQKDIYRNVKELEGIPTQELQAKAEELRIKVEQENLDWETQQKETIVKALDTPENLKRRSAASNAMGKANKLLEEAKNTTDPQKKIKLEQEAEAVKQKAINVALGKDTQLKPYSDTEKQYHKMVDELSSREATKKLVLHSEASSQHPTITTNPLVNIGMGLEPDIKGKLRSNIGKKIDNNKLDIDSNPDVPVFHSNHEQINKAGFKESESGLRTHSFNISDYPEKMLNGRREKYSQVVMDLDEDATVVFNSYKHLKKLKGGYINAHERTKGIVTNQERIRDSVLQANVDRMRALGYSDTDILAIGNKEHHRIIEHGAVHGGSKPYSVDPELKADLITRSRLKGFLNPKAYEDLTDVDAEAVRALDRQATNLSNLKSVNEEDIDGLFKLIDKNGGGKEGLDETRHVIDLLTMKKFGTTDPEQKAILNSRIETLESALALVTNDFKPVPINNKTISSDGTKLVDVLKETYGDAIEIKDRGGNIVEVSWKGYNPEGISANTYKGVIIESADDMQLEMYNTMAADVSPDTARAMSAELGHGSLSQATFEQAAREYTGAERISLDDDNITVPHTENGFKFIKKNFETSVKYLNDITDAAYGAKMTDSYSGNKMTFAEIIDAGDNINIDMRNTHMSYELSLRQFKGKKLSELPDELQAAYIKLKSHESAISTINKLADEGVHTGLKIPVSPVQMRESYLKMRQAKAMDLYTRSKEVDVVGASPPSNINKAFGAPTRVLASRVDRMIDRGSFPSKFKLLSKIGNFFFKANINSVLTELEVKNSLYTPIRSKTLLGTGLEKGGRILNRGATKTLVANALQAHLESANARAPIASKYKDLVDSLDESDFNRLKQFDYNMQTSRILALKEGKEFRMDGDELINTDTKLEIPGIPPIAKFIYESPTFLSRWAIENSRAQNAKIAYAIAKKKAEGVDLDSPEFKHMLDSELAKINVETGDSLRILLTSPSVKQMGGALDLNTYFNAITYINEKMNSDFNANKSIFLQGGGAQRSNTTLAEQGGSVANAVNEVVLKRFSKWFYESVAKQFKALENTIQYSKGADKVTKMSNTFDYISRQALTMGVMGANYSVAVASLATIGNILINLGKPESEKEDLRRYIDQYSIYNMITPGITEDISLEKASSDPLAFLSTIANNAKDLAVMYNDTKDMVESKGRSQPKSFAAKQLQKRTTALFNGIVALKENPSPEGFLKAAEGIVTFLGAGQVVNIPKLGVGYIQGITKVDSQQSLYDTIAYGAGSSPDSMKATYRELDRMAESTNYKYTGALLTMLGMDNNAMKEYYDDYFNKYEGTQGKVFRFLEKGY